MQKRLEAAGGKNGKWFQTFRLTGNRLPARTAAGKIDEK
jgi:hypothetical protein